MVKKLNCQSCGAIFDRKEAHEVEHGGDYGVNYRIYLHCPYCDSGDICYKEMIVILCPSPSLSIRDSLNHCPDCMWKGKRFYFPLSLREV